MPRRKKHATLTHKKRQVGMFKGLPVFDAKEPMVFTVEKIDVTFANNGKTKADKCAGKRALCRQFNFPAAYIGRSMTYVMRKDETAYVRFQTPPSLSLMTKIFDVSGQFVTGAYYIKPPMPSRRQGVERRREYAPRRRGFRDLVPKHTLQGVRARLGMR